MSTKKIINIVLNNFTNDARVLKTSKTLSSAGFDVEVAALHQEGLVENQTIGSVEVIRLKLFTKKLPKVKIIQIFKYFEFVIRAFFQYRNKADVVHCNDLNALNLFFFIKKFSNHGVKIVYDCHEYETERDGMSHSEKKILKFFEKFLIKQADAVLTVSDSIADCYSKDYGVKKPNLVLNCPNLQSIGQNNIFRDELGIDSNKKIFLYQGGLKSGRGIEILVKAFKENQREDCVIVFMGFGPLDKIIKEAQRFYPNIYFYQAVAQEVLMNYTSSANFGILFYEDTCLNHRYCSPNKIFEYFMAELPVIVSSLYEMRKIVQLNKVGLVAEENTVQGFIDSVDKLMQMDYEALKNNVQEIKQTYNWEQQEKVLLDVYRSL